MRQFTKWTIAIVLIGSLTIQADPFKTWDWDEPTEYINGEPIPITDRITYTLHCNTTPDEKGPPYDIEMSLSDSESPPSIQDMDAVVNGRIGTYYCASTATSTTFNVTSEFSNEVGFTVAALDLGFVPAPPLNLRIT